MTTIVPVRFYPPKTAGWSHNIKAADGFYYGVKEELVSLFTLNQPIEVEVVTKEKDGRTYRDIKRVIPNGNGHAAQAQAPEQPKWSTGSAPPFREPDATAERIYVAGVVNNYMQHLGKFQGEADLTEALITVTRAARAAWKMTFGRASE